MKYLFILLLLATSAMAAIQQAEYAFDSDPGPGLATPLAVNAGDTASVMAAVPLGNLPTGLHRLIIRFHSDSLGWGGASYQYFYRFATPSDVYMAIYQATVWLDNNQPQLFSLQESNLTTLTAALNIHTLPAGLHILNARYRMSSGVFGPAESRFVYRFADPQNLAYRILRAQLWFDSGTPTLVDTPDSSTSLLLAALPVTTLPVGLHVLNVRYQDELGNWGAAATQYVYRFAQPLNTALAVTRAQLGFDSDTPVTVDIADSSVSLLYTTLPVGMLASGLHALRVRYRDQNGAWGAWANQFVYRFAAPQSNADSLITTAEVQIDGNTPQSYDVADGALTTLSAALPTQGWSAGVHSIRVRYRSLNGVWSAQAARTLFLIPGNPNPGPPAMLTAAEYFINYDPGEGHGVPIFPTDGTWNSPNETVAQMVPNVPQGHHWLGLRFRDNLNHWSTAVIDSFWVGPMLTIRSSGNDVILDWTPSPNNPTTYVYRSFAYGGAFTRIATVQGNTYSDPGILGTNLRGYYFLTQDRGVISSFRMPAMVRPFKE